MLVDNVLFSMDIWAFYSARQHAAVERNWASTKTTALAKDLVLGALSAEAMWKLLYDTFKLFSDAEYARVLDVSFMRNFDVVRREIDSLELCVVYWACTKAHTKEALGNIDSAFVHETGDRLNRKFHTYAYYMLMAIREQCDSLRTELSSLRVEAVSANATSMLSLTASSNTKTSHEKLDRFMHDIIRAAYGGDFDEFILAVIAHVQKRTMKKFQKQLAIVKGYELFGISDAPEDIDAEEAWRRLFPNVFAKEEDIFSMFYEAFGNECIAFLLVDYFEMPYIKYLPVFKLFTTGDWTEGHLDIRGFIDRDKLHARLLELYA